MQIEKCDWSKVAALTLMALLFLETGCNHESTPSTTSGQNTSSTSNAPTSVELSSNQLNTITVAPLGTHPFPVEKEAVGNITYVDDLNVQVFPNYQGKLLKTFVELGDEVKKGQALYTIDSPDLVNAESTLIGAEATLELTSKELARARDLFSTNVGVSQRELEQAINDQQTAEGAFKAARDALRVFGKSDAEIDQIVAQRKIDPALVVPSPIAGAVTDYQAPPGMLVQPGNAPAPISVADVSVKWMLANVLESDAPMFRVGQPVEVSVMAYPGRVFTGKIDKVYETVDPNVHTMMVRSEVSDPKNELRPGMLANFVVRVQDPVEASAIPTRGVVRESDGTFTAWATTDRHHFVQRIVKLGLEHDGMDQVLEGLQPGELVVTEGAVFLSNLLDMPPSD